MKILRQVLFAAAVALAAPIAASARAPDEAAAAQTAVERGRLIYDLDQAAWHTTDVMLRKLPFKRRDEINGYIVEPDGDAYAALFFGYGEGLEPYAVFTARFKDGKVVSSREVKPGGPRALTQAQKQMVQARDVAGAWAVTDGRSCSSAPLNTVVVPPVSETASIDVYLLTPQTERDAYPFGGHYRVTVGPDGKVTDSRPFMKSCLTQTLPPNVAASMISHLLDPTPTEIHAWLARWTGKPVFVIIDKQLWEVTAAGMRKVDKP